jgi:hypothetical protein
MAWKRENPDGSISSAGEVAFSPIDARKMGYHWEGIGGTYDRAPTEAEYLGFLREKERRGQYRGKPAEKQVMHEIKILEKKLGDGILPPWSK